MPLSRQLASEAASVCMEKTRSDQRRRIPDELMMMVEEAGELDALRCVGRCKGEAKEAKRGKMLNIL
jgi:hypothetical protein